LRRPAAQRFAAGVPGLGSAASDTLSTVAEHNRVLGSPARDLAACADASQVRVAPAWSHYECVRARGLIPEAVHPARPLGIRRSRPPVHPGALDFDRAAWQLGAERPRQLFGRCLLVLTGHRGHRSRGGTDCPFTGLTPYRNRTG